MTFLSLVLSVFPALVMVGAIVSFLYLCAFPSFLSLAALLFLLYGLPLVVYRLHHWISPIQEGISYLGEKTYSPWWGSHQIQAIYITFPALEAGLRLIPGAFSLWLRLWGSKVGRNVYWTPGLEIADRGLLEIGDRVIFGYQIRLSSHVIKPRKQNLVLYVKRIKIGNDVFLGAGSHLGPGTLISDGTYLPVFTILYLNQKLLNPKVTTQAANSMSSRPHPPAPSPWGEGEPD